MHAPTSAAWLLVAVCAASGTYCLLRMRSEVEEQRRAAGGDALMGFGMSAMAVPAALVTPPRAAWLACAAVFGAAALRSAWEARRGARHLHHLVGAGAMVYMSAVMAAAPSGHGAAPSGHGGQGAAGLPVLTGVLLMYFAGYVLWSGARLLPETAGGMGHFTGWGDRPELTRACQLSMGIGMFAMLMTL